MNQQNLKMLPGLTKPLTDSVQRPRLTAVGYSLMMNWCLGLYLYVTISEACICSSIKQSNTRVGRDPWAAPHHGDEHIWTWFTSPVRTESQYIKSFRSRSPLCPGKEGINQQQKRMRIGRKGTPPVVPEWMGIQTTNKCSTETQGNGEQNTDNLTVTTPPANQP